MRYVVNVRVSLRLINYRAHSPSSPIDLIATALLA